MKLSITIVNYKVPEYLLNCLKSIKEAANGISYEILIVDNHSQDNSQKIVTEEFPEVIWIQNNENIGFGKAHNQAIKQAKGEYISILNPDTVLPKNIFPLLINFYEKAEKPGIVGVKMLNSDQKFLPESKRNIPLISNSIEKFTNIKMGKAKPYYATNIGVDDIGEVEIISGAFMFLKKNVFETIGGFDEKFFMFGEDIDISIKSLRNGYKNYYYGKINILHYKGRSVVKNKNHLKYFYNAMHVYVDKYYANIWKKRFYYLLINLQYIRARFK